MMHLEDKILTIMEKGVSQKAVTGILNASLNNSITRRKLLSAVERATYKMCFNGSNRPEKVREEQYYMGRALLRSIGRTLDRGLISKNCTKVLTNVFLRKVVVEGYHIRHSFDKKHGFRPPSFVTISPTNICNLQCKGCYAGDIYEKHTLRYDVFDRAITEINKEFGSRFVVISGGEPFAYRDCGKTLFDILEKHSDSYFMAYTNSTMITKNAAKKLAELGNFTPAISVEGFETETDARRGSGTFKKIMQAMENLREAGVPFGFSVTPTRYNAETLLSDEFIDFYCVEMGAMYGWYFQYMPIGRKPSMELMVTPGQREKMLKRIWNLVINQHLFIADFWNSGTASDGCMAAGRGGGYFYIMWDGTITPCVFIPFKDKKDSNLYDLYGTGKTITDAIKSPFFEKIREWQNSYWMNQPKHKCGNLLVPCAIRDNSETFYNLVKESGALPCDGGAEEYLSFIENGKMPEYNRQCREYADPIWNKEYLKNDQIQIN